jgi:hypothetical protein
VRTPLQNGKKTTEYTHQYTLYTLDLAENRLQAVGSLPFVPADVEGGIAYQLFKSEKETIIYQHVVKAGITLEKRVNLD